MAELLTLWLASYLLHSTVLLGAMWVLERARVLRAPQTLEFGWRLAFFGALVSASVAVVVPEPEHGSDAQPPVVTALQTVRQSQVSVPLEPAVRAPNAPTLTLPRRAGEGIFRGAGEGIFRGAG